jgi:outer membrane receptor protein involved in Fe transport
VQVGNAWYVLQPYDETRTTFNPRVGAVWSATARLTVKALYGEGFRMPTVRELFSVTPSRVSGPDLDPEKVRTAEVRATFGLPGPGFVEAGVFRTAGTDFIALAPTAIPRPGRTSVFNQFTNVAAPRIWGVDLRAQAAVGHGLVLFGHYGFLDPRYAEAVPGIVAYGEPDRIPRVASHQGLLGATWTSEGGRFHASPRLHLVGARPSVETSPLAEVPGVVWLDLSVGMRDVGLRGLGLSLVASNLTSTDILAPGFRTANKQNDFPAAHPEPGFHASAALSYDWGF